MRLPRKLKKLIINSCGRSTYKGIINGYLNFDRYHNNKGFITVLTDKKDSHYMENQCNPYIMIPKIKF